VEAEENVTNPEIPDYFPELPWSCRCGCGFDNVRPELVAKINLARHLAGVPFAISSAVRCEERNRAVGGMPGSAHTTGEAADIRIGNDTHRFYVLLGVLGAGFKRVGISSAFIHVDIAENLPRQRIWTYSK
jgi:uncharacterized protein YcbK (DUF882 family)